TLLLVKNATVDNPTVWIVYGAIFVYYLCATLFPIDKIIGKIYPIFGAILLLSAVGVGIGLFTNGYELTNLSASNWMGIHPKGIPFIPIFFVTVACGIVSGFHSTQSTLIARSVADEREGRMTFFNMMLLEGFIAMIWAAAAMGIYNKGLAPELVGSPAVIGLVSKDLLGNIGGIIAIIGVIVLPITSGDTALRALRLMIADFLNIDQKTPAKRLALSSVIFALVAGILIFAKFSNGGFNILWRYFAWSNQTIAVFSFAMITIYLMKLGKNHYVSLIPGLFYMFIISSYLLNAQIGFRLPMNTAYVIAVVLTLVYGYFTVKQGKALHAEVSIPNKKRA
ncbi:MAG: carbon starvation CstA 5TM domain-containing protein, partial [Proteocatella sp.]